MDDLAQNWYVCVRKVSQLVGPGRERGREYAVGTPHTRDDGKDPEPLRMKQKALCSKRQPTA